MALLKISGIIKIGNGIDFEIGTFFIDLKNKTLWTPKKYLQLPFMNFNSVSSFFINDKVSGYKGTLDRGEYFNNICSIFEKEYAEFIESCRNNREADGKKIIDIISSRIIVGTDIDLKKVDKDATAYTMQRADGSEKYLGAIDGKRRYLKDFVSEIEVGSPLVFYKQYEDKALKADEYSSVAIADVKSGSIGLHQVKQFNKDKYEYEHNNREAYKAETVLLNCIEVTAVEYISLNAEKTTTTKTLRDCIEEFNDDSQMSDRIKLENIRQKTYSALALNANKYNNCFNYELKEKAEIEKLKNHKRFAKSEQSKLNDEVESMKHMKLKDRLSLKNKQSSGSQSRKDLDRDR